MPYNWPSIVEISTKCVDVTTATDPVVSCINCFNFANSPSARTTGYDDKCRSKKSYCNILYLKSRIAIYVLVLTADGYATDCTALLRKLHVRLDFLKLNQQSHVPPSRKTSSCQRILEEVNRLLDDLPQVTTVEVFRPSI